MNGNEFFERGEVRTAYASIDKVFRTGVLNRIGDPLFEAAVTSVLINLNDLLQKASGRGSRIGFTDDVGTVMGSGPRDVTTLISDARNAACHLPSAVQNLGSNRIRFDVHQGLVPNALVLGEDTFGCDYADDIAVQYGPIRVYLKRHVERCLIELQKVFTLE